MRRTVVQIILLVLCLSAQAQTVSNVRAEQRGQDIVILYSLETTSPCEASLLLSQDNGVTWSSALKNVTGDIGKNISSGEKQITWNVLDEREQLVGDKIKFKLVVSEIEKIMTPEEIQRKKNRRAFWENVAGALILPTISAIIITVRGEWSGII
jgi:hypothetical protein